MCKKPYSYAALYRKQECRLADGAPDDARFARPSDVLIDERDPSKLLVLDDGRHSIREVDIATGVRIAENAQPFISLPKLMNYLFLVVFLPKIYTCRSFILRDLTIFYAKCRKESFIFWFASGD